MRYNSHYFIDFQNYRFKVYNTKAMQKELPLKTLQIFKIEFGNIAEVNTVSIKDCLENIYRSLRVRHTKGSSFIVTDKKDFIRVSFQQKYFIDIIAK